MEYTIDITNQILILLIFVTSLNILMGYAGQASVAHAALGGIGGYTAGYLSAHHNWPFLLTLVVGAVGAGIFGALVSLPALNFAWDYLVLLTLAVATIFTDVVSSAPQFGGAYGILGIHPLAIGHHQLLSPRSMLPVTAGLALLVFLFCWRMGESPFGRVLRAIRGDEVLVSSLGKNTVKFKVMTFGITAALAGIGGVLLVYYDQLVTPDQFSFDEAILFVTMLVFGGSASLIGSVIGTAVIFASGPILQHAIHVGAAKASLLQLVIYGAALVLLMRFRPQGILRERRQFWRGATPKPPDPDARTDPPGRAGVGPAGPPATAAAATLATSTMELVATGLRRHFGGIKAVDGVDVTLRSGELVGLIGPNGAGKSTLFALLTGFVQPDAGRLELNGTNLSGVPPYRRARTGLSRSFQDVRLIPDLTVLDNVALASRANPGEQLGALFLSPRRARNGEVQARLEALEWLDFVGLSDRGSILVGELSHGEQKLVALARVLTTGGRLLLLDEPTSGVEHVWIERLAEVIVELPKLGRGVCVVEHNLSFLRLLDCPCIFMETGRIAGTGRLDDLMGVADMQKAYFGL